MPTPNSSSNTRDTDFVGKDYNALLGTEYWSTHNLTFSFGTFASSWSTDVATGYGPTNAETDPGEPFVPGYGILNAAQKDNIRTALNTWSRYADLKFVETADNLHNVGDLRFAFSNGTQVGIEGAQAWAYLPAEAARGGDVWFNEEFQSRESSGWAKGSYDYLTALHEIGHAIGLKHPFAAIEGNEDTLQSGLDSHSFTIMSYSADPGRGHYFSYEATTPMILDIQAIQHLYGKNTTFNAGATTYTYQAGLTYHQTIWDAGGQDTIVYEGNNHQQTTVINLGAGYNYGSRMGQEIDIIGTNLHLTKNIWIAFGTTIENAKGSDTASDTIYGNVVANSLSGRGGADVLYGKEGNDTLIGGSGSDKLTGGTGADHFRFGSMTGSDTVVDFSHAQGDTLQLDNSSFKALGAEGTLAAAHFRANTTGTAVDGDDRILYETDTGKFFYDADGSGAGSKVLIAVLGTGSHHPDLVASDFVIV